MIGTERKFVIGRDASCDVVLADDSVSRRHAELLVFDDGMLFAPAALRLRCDQDRGPAVSHLRALSAALGRLGAATRRIVPLLADRVGPRWTPSVLAIALWLLLVLLLTLALGNPAPQRSATVPACCC